LDVLLVPVVVGLLLFTVSRATSSFDALAAAGLLVLAILGIAYIVLLVASPTEFNLDDHDLEVHWIGSKPMRWPRHLASVEAPRGLHVLLGYRTVRVGSSLLRVWNHMRDADKLLEAIQAPGRR
jgi:hypothetical protein